MIKLKDLLFENLPADLSFKEKSAWETSIEKKFKNSVQLEWNGYDLVVSFPKMRIRDSYTIDCQGKTESYIVKQIDKLLKSAKSAQSKSDKAAADWSNSKRNKNT